MQIVENLSHMWRDDIPCSMHPGESGTSVKNLESKQLPSLMALLPNISIT